MIKKELSFINIKGIHYRVDRGQIVKQKPWLGDLFSFMYDSIMEKSIFPKKFSADKTLHDRTLEKLYSSIHSSMILELACGSGSLSQQLPADNLYTSIDISPSLIKIAIKKFSEQGFTDPQFFISDASDLPFKDSIFDICICNLSFNFFPDTSASLSEIKRVLRPSASFFCSVPVPERKPDGSTIRGPLLSAAELETLFTEAGFDFTAFDITNGAVFYFKAVKK